MSLPTPTKCRTARCPSTEIHDSPEPSDDSGFCVPCTNRRSFLTAAERIKDEYLLPNSVLVTHPLSNLDTARLSVDFALGKPAGEPPVPQTPPPSAHAHADDDRSALTIHLEPDLLERLKRYGRETARDMNGLINDLLEEGLDNRYA